MKRIFLLTAAILMATGAWSQKTEYNYYMQMGWNFYGMSYVSKKEKTIFVNAGITGVTITQKNKKKESPYQKIEYDKQGNCISLAFLNNKGKVSWKSLATYSADTDMLSNINQNGKGKVLQKRIFLYGNFHNVTNEELYRKGKMKSNITCTYDSTRLLESFYFKNGSSDYKRKWVYTYYPNKSKKTSVIYNAKGKALHIWNYDCKPEGQMETKHKDTTTVCKKEETDRDGNKTITTMNYNSKGKPYKTVSVLNKDKKVMQYEIYFDNNMLNYRYKCDPASGNMQEIVYNNRKGHETRKYIYTYDANSNNTGIASYKKGKMTSRWVSSYNNRNLLINQYWFNRKDKVENSYKYEYSSSK